MSLHLGNALKSTYKPDDRDTSADGTDCEPGQICESVNIPIPHQAVVIPDDFADASKSIDDDDPAELERMLRELAGPSWGPDADGGLDTWLSKLLDDYAKATRIWCNPKVIEQMKKAWSLTGNGTKRGGEAYFIVNGSKTHPTPWPAKTGNTYNKETFRIFGNTIAIFHVHSTATSTMWPSTPENTTENNGKGDTGLADEIKRDIYVMHRNGLSVYNYQAKEVYLLRSNLDWMKPCD